MTSSVDIKKAKNLVKKIVDRALFGSSVDPVFLHSAPGIGKSSVVKQVGQETGVPVVDIRVSAMDAADVQGIPYVGEDGEMKFSTPQWFQKCLESKNGILFLDEISNAPLTVQGAAYRIVLDREIQNGKKLPEGWVIVAAGNRAEDKSGAKNLSTALANRFGMHLGIETDKDSLVGFAVENKWDSRIVGFLEFKPDFCHKMPESPAITAFPTPRSWNALSNHFLANDLSEDEMNIVIEGCVGEAACHQLMAFIKHYDKLPNWDNIRKGEKYKVDTDNLGLCFAISTSIVYEVRSDLDKDNDDGITAILGILDQLSEEYHILFFKLLNQMKKQKAQDIKKILNHKKLKSVFDNVREYLPN